MAPVAAGWSRNRANRSQRIDLGDIKNPLGPPHRQNPAINPARPLPVSPLRCLGPLARAPRLRHERPMDWIKIIHILCVMGWMTSIFAVPRALIYWKRDHAKTGEFGPLGDLTYRLYRFSAGLMVIALLTGIYLGAAVFQFAPWVLVKLGLVVLLGGHYMMTGGMVMRAKKGEFRESDFYLRVFNEISVLGVVAILWVVVVKPF